MKKGLLGLRPSEVSVYIWPDGRRQKQLTPWQLRSRKKEKKGLGTKYTLQCYTPLTFFLQPGPASQCYHHWVAYEVWICKGVSPSTKASHPFPRSLVSAHWCIMNQSFSAWILKGHFKSKCFHYHYPLVHVLEGPLELPMDVQIHRCSSPFHKMEYCLHTTYTHILLNPLCHLHNNAL